MPLFEYRCLSCDAEFELLIRGSAAPVCPACGATTLERLISMFAASSEDSQMRNRESLGAQQRRRAKANQKEREHYRTEHHDD
jgi:putative FmdB family regulatory protein